MNSQAQSALMTPGPEVTALRQLFGELLRDTPARRRIAELMAGAEPVGDGGLRFAPDLALTTVDGGAVRLAELMRGARPLLLIGGDGDNGYGGLVEATAAWRDRVDVVTATSPASTALLVRPDGYLAWSATPGEAAQAAQASLRQALTDWFGARSSAPGTP